MRCTYCNEKLAVHDLWCNNCGRRTENISTVLAGVRNLNETWKKYKQFKGSNFPAGIWAVLTGILPLCGIFWIVNYALPEMPLWLGMIIKNLVWLIFLPVLLVPFQAVCARDGYQISVKQFFQSFLHYPKYFVLILSSLLFYLIIHFVCIGDPILRLVWLVLVIYWIVIVIPVPVLMERYKINAFKGIRISYHKAGDLRWNIFLMAIILSLANILSALLLVVGLAVILPYTWFAIRDYVDKMIEFEVFDLKDNA